MTDSSTWAQIIDALSEDDFARDGAPKVKALEDGYAAAFPDDPIDLNAEDRDEIWAEYQVEPEENNTFTLIASKQNPLRITVNGRTILEMYVGQTADIDPDVLAQATAVPHVIFVRGTSNDNS